MIPQGYEQDPNEDPQTGFESGIVCNSLSESWNHAEDERFHREDSGAGDGNRTHVSSLGTPAACVEEIKVH